MNSNNAIDVTHDDGRERYIAVYDIMYTISAGAHFIGFSVVRTEQVAYSLWKPQQDG